MLSQLKPILSLRHPRGLFSYQPPAAVLFRGRFLSLQSLPPLFHNSNHICGSPATMHPFAPQPSSAPQKAPHFFLPNAKKEEALRLLPYGFRQRPILPGRVQPSTFGTEGLNFCVRYGNRWDPFVITTGNIKLFCFCTLTTAHRMIHD